MFSFYKVVEALERIEEFYLDPSLRPVISRLAKSGTEIKDSVQKKKFFGTIRSLAKQRQKSKDKEIE